MRAATSLARRCCVFEACAVVRPVLGPFTVAGVLHRRGRPSISTVSSAITPQMWRCRRHGFLAYAKIEWAETASSFSTTTLCLT